MCTDIDETLTTLSKGPLPPQNLSMKPQYFFEQFHEK